MLSKFISTVFQATEVICCFSKGKAFSCGGKMPENPTYNRRSELPLLAGEKEDKSTSI